MTHDYLNTVAAATTAAYLAAHRHAGVSAARVHGYATAAGSAAAVLLGAAVLVAALVNADRPGRH